MPYGSEDDLIFEIRNKLAEAMEATGQRKLLEDHGRRVASRLVRSLKTQGWEIRWTKEPNMVGFWGSSKPQGT